MPSVPNFLNSTMTPLGQAFNNLAGALASQPTEAERELQAEQLAAARAKAQEDAQSADAAAYKQQGLSKLGDLLANPQLYAPSPSVSVKPTPGSVVPTVNTSNISTAPPIDWGKLVQAGVQAGLDPDKLGGYVRFGEANANGVRDVKTTNAVVSAGQPYSATAESFDINQNNDMAKAAATNATSRANNAANNAKDIQIEGMKEAHDDNSVPALTPAQLDYQADIYRRTGQLPALGMGKAAAGLRSQILARAADLDRQDGRGGADAAAQFAEYQGERSGQRTAGVREAQAGMAVNELSNLIPVAKTAFSKVSRTGFVPADKLLQAYQEGTNDPDLNAAAVAVNDVVNAHARAINPNGQVTDAGRAQGYQLLNTAKDQNAFNAILDQMMVGAQAALKSPGQTRSQLRHDASAPLPARDGGPQPTSGTEPSIEDLLNKYGGK